MHSSARIPSLISGSSPGLSLWNGLSMSLFIPFTSFLRNQSQTSSLIWMPNFINVDSWKNTNFIRLNNWQLCVEGLQLDMVFSGRIFFAFAIHRHLCKVHVSRMINDPLHVHIVTTEVFVFDRISRKERLSNVFVRDVLRDNCVNIHRENSPFPSNILLKRPDGVLDISSFPAVSFFFSVYFSMVFVSSPSSFLDLVKLERVFNFSSILWSINLTFSFYFFIFFIFIFSLDFFFIRWPVESYVRSFLIFCWHSITLVSGWCLSSP